MKKADYIEVIGLLADMLKDQQIDIYCKDVTINDLKKRLEEAEKKEA